MAALRSLPLLLLLALGCHASVQGNAKANANGDADAELDAEVQKERAAANFAGTKPDVPIALATTTANRPLLGARSDLTLAGADVPGQCSCVRAALGPANLGAFRWKGEVPSVDDQTQLVLALSSEGSGCTNPKGSLGASYWGYRRTGDDVVVYLENGVPGRPVAAGAIIPKPFGQGQVYLAPAKKGVIYGKGADGKAQCKLGNPGAPRTVPVSADEMGAGSAPADASPASLDDLATGR